MKNFPYVLSFFRRQRGLTQRALAVKIKKTPAYVCALEAESSDKMPSLETLRDLVHALAEDPKQPHGLNVKVVLPLIGSVFGWTYELVPPEVSAAEDYDEAFERAQVVWNFSNTLVEFLSPEKIEELVGKIKNNQTRFVFLVPFSVTQYDWKRLTETLERKLSRDEIEKHVSIFYASQSAFACHYTICDPLSSGAKGFYSFGPSSAGEAPTIHRMPPELLMKIVEVFRNLCWLFHSRLYGTNTEEEIGGVIGDFVHGHIQLQFPLERAKAIRQRFGMGAEQDFGHLTGSTANSAVNATPTRPAWLLERRTLTAGFGV